MPSRSGDSAIRAVHGIQGGPGAKGRSPSEKRVGFADDVKPSSSTQIGERKDDADGPSTGRPGVIRICVPSQVRHPEVPSIEGAACGSSETVDLAANAQQDHGESIDDFMRRTEFELFGPSQCCGSGEMSGALSVQPGEQAGAPAGSAGESGTSQVLRPLSLSSTATAGDEHPGHDSGCNLMGERARGASTSAACGGAAAEHALQSPSGSDDSTGSSVASILRLQPADARGSDHSEGSDQASQASMRSISQSLTSARIAALGDGRGRSSHRRGSNGAVLEGRIQSDHGGLGLDDRWKQVDGSYGAVARGGAGQASAGGQPSTGHNTQWTIHGSGPGGAVCAPGNTVGERDLTAASDDEEDEDGEGGLDGFESDSGVFSD